MVWEQICDCGRQSLEFIINSAGNRSCSALFIISYATFSLELIVYGMCLSPLLSLCAVYNNPWEIPELLPPTP